MNRSKLPMHPGRLMGFSMESGTASLPLFAFVVSLFTDRVNIYEVHNNGNWYDFGFMLGASITVFGGCGGSAASQRKRKRRCCEDKDESKD